MPKKINEIIFFTIDFPPTVGGMARYSLDIARAIRAAGEDLTVIACEVSAAEKYADETGLRIMRLKGVKAGRCFDHYYRSLFIFFIHGFFYCITHRVRVIFVNTWSLIGPAALILSKIFNIPYFVFSYGLDVYAPLKDRKAMWLMKLVLRHSSLTIAISRFTRDLVEREIGGVKSTVLNPVVDLGRFKPVPGRISSTLENKKIILTVSRLVESKNHESVIRAMPEVIKAVPDAVYCIVGDGPLIGRLKLLAADLGVKDKVFFSGDVDEERLSQYYFACDIFILVSKEIPERGEVEGFGIVFLEAAACSKAVIAGRSGGIADAVLDGETGILVDPLDVEAISSGIIKLLCDDALRKRLGDNARKRVEADLNTDKLRDRIKDIINAKLDR